MEGDKSLRSPKQIKNTSSSEPAGMRTKAGANLTPQQNSKITPFGHPSRAWLLDNHSAPRPMLWNFPINKDHHHHLTQNTCQEKNIITNKPVPLAKTEKMRSRKTMTRKRCFSIWSLCIQPFNICTISTRAPEQSKEQNSVCFATPYPKHIAAKGWGDLAHIFIPLHSCLLKRTSWAQLPCGYEPN